MVCVGGGFPNDFPAFIGAESAYLPLNWTSLKLELTHWCGKLNSIGT